MRETWQVLGETWRRFWPNPLVWAAPVCGWAGTLVIGMFMMLLLFLGPLGMLIDLAAAVTYGAALLAVLVGACSAVARTGKAAWQDVRTGLKLYFWKACGLIGITLGVGLLLGLVVGLMVFPLVLSPVLRQFEQALVFPSAGQLVRFMAWGAALGFVTNGLLALFLGFAPAAMGLEGAAAPVAVDRGVRFVGRRFAVAGGLVLCGLVVCIVLPALPAVGPSLAMVRSLPSLMDWTVNSAAAPGAAPFPPVAWFGVMASTMAWASIYGVLTLILQFLALPFFLLSTFIAYERSLPKASREAEGGSPSPGAAGCQSAPGR